MTATHWTDAGKYIAVGVTSYIALACLYIWWTDRVGRKREQEPQS